MWEVRAAPGRLAELVEAVRQAADPSAQLYSSADPDERVVVIDPTLTGVTDIPADLIARPPHEWIFEVVDR